MSGSRIPYFDFYPTDFMRGVRGLTAAEVGIYTMLLCRIYEENGPVEYHPVRLSAYCGVRESVLTKAVDRLLVLGRIEVKDGMLSDDRAMREIGIRETKLKNSSRAGKASAEKRQKNQRQDATPVEQAFNHKDTDEDKKKGEANASPCAGGVKAPSFDEFWSSWPLAKVAKDTARKAYGRLSPQQRIGATTHAAEWCASWRAANPRLNDIHPSSYLNQKRWEDEAQPTLKVINGGPREPSGQDYRAPSHPHPTDRAIAFASRAVRTPSKDCF